MVSGKPPLPGRSTGAHVGVGEHHFTWPAETRSSLTQRKRRAASVGKQLAQLVSGLMEPDAKSTTARTFGCK